MISRIFIERPRLAAVISIIITLAGMIALKKIPVAKFPPILPPQVRVTARYPGASAEVVAETVAAPIEREVNGVDNMQWVWSWWAFFGTWAFLLYRKQYIPALVLFILSTLTSFIPFAGFIVAILSGGYSTYFVYQGYKDKKSKIEASISDIDKRIETMRKIGGYNQWVIWVYVTFTTILFLYVTTLLFALMPN